MTSFKKNLNNPQDGSVFGPEREVRLELTQAELVTILHGLAAESRSSGRWAEAESLALRALQSIDEPIPALTTICSVIFAQAENNRPAIAASVCSSISEPVGTPIDLECKNLLRHVRTLIEMDRLNQAESILHATLSDRNRIDPLSGRAEMVTILAAIHLREGQIGGGLDLFAHHLPGDLVTASAEIGPTPAAMQAELLCAAGERHAACDIAARLKLLWPRDPIVSRLLGKVLEPEIPNLKAQNSANPISASVLSI